MSFINHQAKEIHCKIVYYGPSLGGKTTSLKWVYNQIATPGQPLGEADTATERTLFFDFLPLDIGDVRGFKTRFHLYSVPGQLVYDASRKLIMKGIDGVIFVADSQKSRMEENKESMRNLEKNLELQGNNLREIPLVLQYNKRDLENVTSLKDMRLELNPYNAPEFESTASLGIGVMESLKAVSKSIVHILKGGQTW